MVHIFYGNAAVAVRQKAFAFLARQEAQGSKLERIDADTYIPGICADIANSASLFGEKTMYLIDTPSTDAAFYEEVTGMLEAFKESDNLVVIIEVSLLAAQKKLFAKYADTIEEITTNKEERYNVFALADSLSKKDKKTLWIQLQDAKQTGLSAEEIIGTLWWQLKSLRLAKLTKNASEAGMKDFTYNKAKRSLSYFDIGELEKLSETLLVVYHDGHLGKTDIDLGLEKWILTM